MRLFKSRSLAGSATKSSDALEFFEFACRNCTCDQAVCQAKWKLAFEFVGCTNLTPLNARRVHWPPCPSSQVLAKQHCSFMVCGVNSCQSELAGSGQVTHDGRLNTELVHPSFGTAATLFGTTFGFRAEGVQLPGFFFTVRAERETIAAYGTTQGT